MNEVPELIIGVTGRMGAGKTTFTHELGQVISRHDSATRYRGIESSNPIKRYLLEKERALTRVNFAEGVREMRALLGEDVVERGIIGDMVANPSPIISVTGIRTFIFEQLCHDFFSNTLYLPVAIEAEDDQRYLHYRSNQEKTDAQTISRAYFDELDHDANELPIEELMRLAQVKFTNNGSKQEYQAQIREWYFRTLYKGGVSPADYLLNSALGFPF